MATENIEITQTGWQNLETVGGITLTNNQVYCICFRGNNENEIAVSDSTPAESLMGHPVGENVNFNFTYTGSDVWVKCQPLQAGKAYVILT